MSQKTEDWSEIQATMEDQLRAHRNWNLHLLNTNSDLTGLKDSFCTEGEYLLGCTGQFKMEVKAVTAPVMKTPVLVAQVRAELTIDDCKDVVNALGNYYSCNKPGHVKRNCPAPGHFIPS